MLKSAVIDVFCSEYLTNDAIIIMVRQKPAHRLEPRPLLHKGYHFLRHLSRKSAEQVTQFWGKWGGIRKPCSQTACPKKTGRKTGFRFSVVFSAGISSSFSAAADGIAPPQTAVTAVPGVSGVRPPSSVSERSKGRSPAAEGKRRKAAEDPAHFWFGTPGFRRTGPL